MPIFSVIATISCLLLSSCSRTVHFLPQLQGSCHNSINVRGTQGSYLHWIWLENSPGKTRATVTSSAVKKLATLLHSELPNYWCHVCFCYLHYLLPAQPTLLKVNNKRLLKRRLLLGFMTPNRGGSTGNCLLADYEMRLRSGLDNLKRVFEPIIVIFFSFWIN